ncbi:hypothetical protein PTTG_00895 [Puccinia triticina 1-1 BBBD Race 1]|uniref:Expansin-like EG45 domain-containing protein n=2 Tax=Puccinia triticina TaxID=208348 RepID=A0A0C4EJH7_PUCT1|nr:uncharacterized protein PtA15_13A85 [Puccinia triticina]OAV93283.1 hypothetical protein PTTG_00895 [Puccinia triticina 1-1 BBBD Race 1]WAQ90686.1 hypothetical protein PtA15_13A85 [Puccinia triticina]WAR60842.1 hypothetical protein PtB15_13B88 [Puccinia triticina]
MVMIYKAPTASLVLFCFLLFLIPETTAISSGEVHHHPGAATSKLRRRSAPLSETYSGKGTYHPDDWTSGNCAFIKWPRPQGLGPVAIASNMWNSSQSCGACLEIEGPSGGRFTGIVSNQCPSCEQNGLDLDVGIWNQVSGNQSPGIISLKWKIVPCGFSKPIIFMNKSGVSQYWTSIQVQGANTPLKSLEVSTNGGSSWTALERQSNSNYFQPKDGKGLGTTGDIRVTCLSGKQFVTKNVDLANPESPKPGSANC